MSPNAKGAQSAATTVNGPHGGQASIRKAYETLGVECFYALHGTHYKNPHEAQIFSAVSQLLDSIPATVWLGQRELEPDVLANVNKADSDENDSEGGAESDGSELEGTDISRSPRAECSLGQRPYRHPSRSSAALLLRTRPSPIAPAQITTSGGASSSPISAAPSPLPVTVTHTRSVHLACPDLRKQAPSSVHIGDSFNSCSGFRAGPQYGPRATAGGGRQGRGNESPPLAGDNLKSSTTITYGVSASIPLRILDLACGSGEATAAIVDWNQRHPLTGLAAGEEASAAVGVMTACSRDNSAGGAGPCHLTHKTHGRAPPRSASARTGSDIPAVILPYDLHITACDPYTGAAYLERTGCAALNWSFEDIADGCLVDWEPPVHMPLPLSQSMQPSAGNVKQQQRLRKAPPSSDRRRVQAVAAVMGAGATAAFSAPAATTVVSAPPLPPLPSPLFDLVVCSFALHLCDPSRLYSTCTALSLAARWLAVLAPHKRPLLAPELGWSLVVVRKVERTHLRLYRSLRADGASGSG